MSPRQALIALLHPYRLQELFDFSGPNKRETAFEGTDISSHHESATANQGPLVNGAGRFVKFSEVTFQVASSNDRGRMILPSQTTVRTLTTTRSQESFWLEPSSLQFGNLKHKENHQI